MRSGSGSRGTRMVPVPVEVLGTVNTSVVTPPDQPVKLTYVARDAAGNTARVERTVEVYDPCMKAAGERSAVRTDAPTPGTTVGNGADTSAAGVGGSMPYIISYDVADTAGNRARTVYRRVYVACRYPEFPCPLAGGDGGNSGSGATSCSVAGICGVGAAADLSLAPAVQLLNMSAAATVPSGGSAATLVPRLELLGASTVRVRAGALYDSCQGLGTEVCDPGANATSAAPGDLAGQVVACADRASAAGVAAPRPFVLVGLRYCGLDTRLPGRYKISFHLALGSSTEDSSGSSRSSELMSAAELVVYRTVLVEEECEAGEVGCDDGSCSTASGVCDDVLAGRLGAVAATTGVVVTEVAGTAGGASTNAATGGAASPDQGIAVASSAGLMSALAAQLAHMGEHRRRRQQ
ncbi:hypothetical protein HYH02_015540 [Chlamydomonas schloesseri]|uniref:Uncharacterized protein n=1 Tax=Chlamydomonas schloesseri TaxID=2026947 RepID=A0A835VNM4_9CHLO|nr:hypothetical protein HYH02_015540 [Chlamydomonas schloesseri]|eukprot:KAG2422020.1 hypothetical protein HYH02_015540 [Chlamydomonas schloesseri]